MSKEERVAFRILASLYPDSKPSEIRKIIDDALAKEECKDDVELWIALAKNAKEEKTEEPVKKVIEEHHYHHYDWYRPYTITYGNTDSVPTTDKWTITCNDSSNTYTDINSITASNCGL